MQGSIRSIVVDLRYGTKILNSSYGLVMPNIFVQMLNVRGHFQNHDIATRSFINCKVSLKSRWCVMFRRK
jgi:hypothetical protein